MADDESGERDDGSDGYVGRLYPRLERVQQKPVINLDYYSLL